ncbi:uncharacterized protein LOC106478695 [Limulus polyphemus]|uniref:Uncharacterized protein LOC106478695 n=1 Tax=Limulus polyphemus TaxID=6850 RepID=A0ABM1C5R8_LIMPO|nr:uncharacterized protein LOC106478695 [Limulus polyphemus]
MGAILAIPIAFFAYHLLTTEDLPPLYGVYSLPDRYFWLKKAVALLYLKMRRCVYRRRFDLYDMSDLMDLVKTGYIPPAEEKILEAPRPTHQLTTTSDELFFYGVKSTGECLVVKISRLQHKIAEVMVLLRTSKGNHYSYPEGPVCQVFTGDSDGFSGGGLKIKCMSAMRKWRISFNGLLRETCQKSEKSRLVHVKISFIWSAISTVQDMTSDINQSHLAEALSKESWCKNLPDINKLEKALNMYEQGGQLLGTVTIEGLEEEYILWGTRRRCLSEFVEFHRSADFFAFTKNGNIFHIGAVSLPGIVTNLVYGHYIHSNGMMYTTESCDFMLPQMGENKKIPSSARFIFIAGGKTFECLVNMKEHLCNFISGHVEQHFKYSSVILNGDVGCGICVFAYKTSKYPVVAVPTSINIFHKDESEKLNSLVVDFDHPDCQMIDLAGGKGSSLGKLTAISHQLHSFHVPKGVVITTSAYNEFIRKGWLHETMTSLQEVAWGHVEGNLKDICEQVVTAVSKTRIPKEVSETIQNKMQMIFGSEFHNLRFAVRSSAIREDSDDMSAAGQNETFLGVKGLQNIFETVSKCWASQFSFVAIEYKRCNGQLLNSPMAVVIQEMVPADVAGVMFTCDPVTANPAVITITANYGLGETVVSAAVEPDTILLDRDYTNKLTYQSVSIGKKNICAKVNSDGEIQQTAPTNDPSQPCLSESLALAIGQTGILIEEYFGSLRDIEWAVVKEFIYILQARPVTSADAETEFEIIHQFDTPLHSENEFLCKVNFGEVMPGATTPLGLIMNYNVFETVGKKIFLELGFPSERFSPYSSMNFSCKFNHVFHNMVNDPFLGGEGKLSAGYEIAFYGRHLRDKELADRIKDRYIIMDMSLPVKLKQLSFMIKSFLQASKNLKQAQKTYANYFIPLNCEESDTMYKIISKNFVYLPSTPLACHGSCSISSLLWNSMLLNLLASAEKEWNAKVFSDFGYLLSTCTNVESADVPDSLEKLALEISKEIDKEEFKNMTTEYATRFLKVSQSSAGQSFRKFLHKHGHRGAKEFDVGSVLWGVNPRPVVKTLQSLVGSVSYNVKEKVEVTVEEAISNLQVSLSWWQKLLLRFLLPRVRKGVQQRESSKSLLMKMYNIIRCAYCYLSILMVKEGRLPDASLLFFLTHEEIGELLQTRSSRLITKAVRRKRVHPQLDALCFPEISRGITKPVNQTSRQEQNSSSAYLSGTPASKGIARGPIRIVTSLEQAEEIQAGDILVTYSTDIGWSPYFPLLSGIATELGGLISHGVVVAREYGIPCVVGLHGATSYFKSGEMAQLDGNVGRLQIIIS